MLKKIITVFMLLLIMAIIVSSVNAQLPAPNEERECWKWGTGSDLFMCFVPVTQEFAMWFYNYSSMHEYYTPQLKEVNVSAGETYTLTSRKNPSVLMITGGPSYLYVKQIK